MLTRATQGDLNITMSMICWHCNARLEICMCKYDAPVFAVLYVRCLRHRCWNLPSSWRMSSQCLSVLMCEYSPMAAAHPRPQMVQLWDCEVTSTPAFLLSLFSCRSDIRSITLTFKTGYSRRAGASLQRAILGGCFPSCWINIVIVTSVFKLVVV